MKQPTLSDKLKELQALKKGGEKAAKTDTPKTEPRPKTSKHHGPYKYEKKGGNGGARPNSGPDPLPPDQQRKRAKQSFLDFAREEIDVITKTFRDGNVEQRKEKAARLRVLQQALYKKAAEGDVPAIREFFDRVLGKSAQVIIGDEEEAPVQINIVAQRILDKVYGNKK